MSSSSPASPRLRSAPPVPSSVSSVLLGLGLAGAVAAGLFAGSDRTAAAGARVALTHTGDGAPEHPPTLEAVVDQRRLRFRESEDPRRVVADVAATLVRGPDGLRLRIVASAVAPLVVPGPGWRGVAGGNRITAEEMGALLDRGALEIAARRAEAHPWRRGEPPTSRRGRLVERALDALGAVEERESLDELALEATFLTAPLTRGASEIAVVADGRPRVRAVVSGPQGAERITVLDELDGDGVVVRAP